MKNRFFAVLLSAAILIPSCLFSVPCAALDTDLSPLTVLQDVTYTQVAPMMQYAFDALTDTTFWNCSEADVISVVNDGFGTDSCLSVTSEPTSIPRSRPTAYHVKSVIDSTYQMSDTMLASSTMIFSVFLPDSQDSADFTVTLMQGETLFTASAQLGTSWNVLFLDLTRFQKQEGEINISFSLETDVENNSPFSWCLDELSLCTDSTPYRSLRYLTNDYYRYGGTLTYSEGSDSYMEFSFSDAAAEPFLETLNLQYADFSGKDTVCLRLQNQSDCSSIKLYYNSEEENTFTEAHAVSAQISADSEIQNLYFPILNHAIRQIRIQFIGATEGSILFFSVSAISYLEKIPACGSVESCQFTASNHMTISGTVNAETLTRNRPNLLSLYELNPGDYPADVDFSLLTPLASVTPSESFTFDIGSADTDFTDRKFVVALEYSGTYSLLCDAFYVTNPEYLSSDSSVYPTLTAKKGIIGSEAWSYMEDLGSRYAVISVDLGALVVMSAQTEKAEYQGISLNLSDSILSYLDRAAKNAEREGMNLYLQLTVTPSASSIVNSLMIYPSTSQGRYYAFNTSSTDGVKALHAVVSFLSNRYPSLSGYIVGNDVNCSEHYVFDGNYSAAVNAYTDAFRIIYNTAKSIRSSTRIYLSINNEWDSDDIGNGNELSERFLSAFADRIQLGGAIPFHVYLHQTVSETVSNGQEHTTLSSADYRYFCRYLTALRQKLQILNTSVILYDDGYGQDTIANQKRFVYAYLTVSTDACNLVDAYLIPDTALKGMEQLVRLIDTDKADSVLTPILSSFSVSDYADLIPGYAPSISVKRRLSYATMSKSYPASILGSVTLFDFSDSTDGFESASSSLTLRSGESYLNHENVMFAVVNSASLADYRSLICRFPYTRSFTVSPIFSLEGTVLSLPESLPSVMLEITLCSGENRFYATAEITSGDWCSLSFDASSFDGIAAVDAVRIRIYTANGESIGDPTLILSNFKVNSTEHDSEKIASVFEDEKAAHEGNQTVNISALTLWIPSVIIVICVMILLIRRGLHRRNNTADSHSDDNEIFRFFDLHKK